MPLLNSDSRRLPTSRYHTRNVVEVDDQVRKVTRIVDEVRDELDKSMLGTDYQIYHSKSGDQLDWLSYIFLGDTRYWWVIADLNKDVLQTEDALRIPVGTKLIIPNEKFVSGRRNTL